MAKKVLPKKIKYFELDDRVDVENYKSVAVKTKYDKEYIASQIKSYHEILPGLVKEVDDVSDLDKSEVEYYSNLWIEKDFYSYINDKIEESGVDIQTGSLCLYLLILKHLDRFFKRLIPGLPSNASGYLSYFICELLEPYFFDTSTNIAVCYKDKGHYVPLPHQSYILKRMTDAILSQAIREEEEGNNELAKILWLEIEPIIPNKKGITKDTLSNLRRTAIYELNRIFESSKLKTGKKMIMINDLLAHINFMDYLPVRKTSFGKIVKTDQENVIDKIEAQIKAIKKVTE